MRKGITKKKFCISLDTEIYDELQKICIKTDAKMSDNFFHMRPGATITIKIKPARQTNITDLRKKLIIRSLVDTY